MSDKSGSRKRAFAELADNSIIENHEIISALGLVAEAIDDLRESLEIGLSVPTAGEIASHKQRTGA